MLNISEFAVTTDLKFNHKKSNLIKIEPLLVLILLSLTLRGINFNGLMKQYLGAVLMQRNCYPLILILTLKNF